MKMLSKTKIISIVMVVLLHSCDSKFNAQSEIEKKLKNNLHDPDSYEMVSFSVIDTSYFSYLDSKEGASEMQEVELLTEKQDSLNKLANKITDKYDVIKHSLSLSQSLKMLDESDEKIKEGHVIKIKSDSILSIILKKTKEFIPKKIKTVNYELKYRAKNKLGAKILETTHYSIDTNNTIREIVSN
jgi:hypothetical protein